MDTPKEKLTKKMVANVLKEIENQIRQGKLTYKELVNLIADRYGIKNKTKIYILLYQLKNDDEFGELLKLLEHTKERKKVDYSEIKEVLKDFVRKAIQNRELFISKGKIYDYLIEKGYSIHYNTFKKLLAQAVEEVLNELESQNSVKAEKHPQKVKSDEETQRENIPTGESPKTDTEKPPLKAEKEIKSTSKGKKVEPLKKEPVKVKETNPLSVRETEGKKHPKKPLKPSVPEDFDWNKYAYKLANTPMEKWNIEPLLALDNKERFEFLRDKVAKCIDKRNIDNIKPIYQNRERLGLSIEQCSDILKMAGTWKTWKSLIKRDVLLYGKEKAKEIHKGKIEQLRKVCPEDYIENYVLKGELEN